MMLLLQTWAFVVVVPFCFALLGAVTTWAARFSAAITQFGLSARASVVGELAVFIAMVGDHGRGAPKPGLKSARIMLQHSVAQLERAKAIGQPTNLFLVGGD